MDLHGIITPVVSPLNVDLSLDFHGLEKLIEHLINGGVHGLFVLGTTGEGPHLSHAKRREFIKETIRINRGRLPVLMGVTDSSVVELIEMCAFAKDVGVDAVVLAAPFYAPISQEELASWLMYVIPKISVPIILYDIPSHTNIKISVDVIQKASAYDHVIGVKDSSGDMSGFHVLLAKIKRPDFLFFTGPEIILADSILAGGHGGVPGGSNLYPKLFSKLYAAATQNNIELVRDCQKAVRALYTNLYSVEGYGSGFMYGLHAALGHKQLCHNVMMPPFFTNQLNIDIAKILSDLEQEFPILIQ